MATAQNEWFKKLNLITNDCKSNNKIIFIKAETNDCRDLPYDVAYGIVVEAFL